MRMTCFVYAAPGHSTALRGQPRWPEPPVALRALCVVGNKSSQLQEKTSQRAKEEGQVVI